jgi:hypothetical protein
MKVGCSYLFHAIYRRTQNNVILRNRLFITIVWTPITKWHQQWEYSIVSSNIIPTEVLTKLNTRTSIDILLSNLYKVFKTWFKDCIFKIDRFIKKLLNKAKISCSKGLSGLSMHTWDWHFSLSPVYKRIYNRINYLSCV